ncbi:alpha/beta fold hydrolase [Streptomyces botrytidirepellens]|uniref:Alpha/beta hydrolase n=1 Tax=Streptomyces botrytidirepellens TaxID=2486417 RepID=A0A3M8WXH4_9ACTN|nr:alpha/beta hydrolase [Streptomyces botrytidirepellens]RNG34114.1 alpha/beta hydrolase [Streptomyces botrytidirepellens]
MTEPKTGTLKVPGATLHYEVRGSGPVLLMIPGGAGDAASYDHAAAALADRYTVVSYDRRGASRSTLDGPPTDQRVEVHGEDAFLLLDAVAPDGEPAYVFGCSAGAIVAVDLLARHPERVRLAIAHEPPLVELLPDAEKQRAFFAEVRAAYRREGVGAAMAVMAAGTLPQEQAPEKEDRGVQPPPFPAEVIERMTANLPYYLEHILCPFTGHTPDLEALAAVSERLVPAGGRESHGLLLYRPAVALAERLGTEVVDFPGGHTGLSEHPAEFTEVLREILPRR